MTEQIFYYAALIFLLTIGVSLDRLGVGSGGRSWAISWLSLYAAGGVALLAIRFPAVGFLYPALATGFALLLYKGVREYLDQPMPNWLMPVGILVAVARGLAEPFVSHAFTQISGALVLTIGALAASHAMLRRPNADVWDRLLGVGFLSLPIASGLFAYWRVTEIHGEPVYTMWILIGVFVGFLQVCALMNRLTQRVAQQHSTLAALVESVPIGLALSDTDGKLRTMNSEFVRQLRIDDPEARIGRPFVEIADRLRSLVEPDIAREMARARDRLTAANAGLAEMEFRFLDGRVATGAAHVVRSSTGSAQQRTLGQVWYLKDVTEERRLDGELRHARQLEALGSLAGGVAHDFNNKLTAVLGNASLLNETLDPDDPNREILRDLEAAAQYCAELTRDLLTLARQSPRTPVATDPRTFLPSLANRLRGNLPERIDLEVHVAEDCAHVVADAVQLERAVTNLVINARDSIPGRGTIRIDAGLAAGNPARWVEVAVRDDGSGMDSETRERIFDPFYTTKEVGEGTGLGLAIVLGIVSAHGGEVAVESAPGRGTKIATTWPVTTALGVSQTDEPSARVAIHGSETLLIVDDEAPVRRFIRATLESAGFRVLEAASGAAAIEVFEQSECEVDLALVDLAMPGLSGTDVATRLRAKCPGLPILLMSGNLEIAREAIDSLKVEGLAKPFRSAALLQSIRGALDERPL